MELEEPQPVPCPECGIVFRPTCALQVHLSRRHGGRIPRAVLWHRHIVPSARRTSGRAPAPPSTLTQAALHETHCSRVRCLHCLPKLSGSLTRKTHSFLAIGGPMRLPMWRVVPVWSSVFTSFRTDLLVSSVIVIVILMIIHRHHHSHCPSVAILAQVTSDISSPPWLEPRWRSHPDQPGSVVVLTICDAGSMLVRH